MSVSEKKFPSVKSIVLICLAIVMVIGTARTGWQWWTTGRFVETTDNAYVEADVTAIAPKVSGYVTQILVDENSWVKKGQILLTIEPRDYQAQVARMTAYAEASRAKVTTLDGQIALQKSYITQAKATIVSAQAEVVRSKSDLDRYRNLQQNRAASRQKLDMALANSRKAEAALDGARAMLAAERNKLKVLMTQRLEAEAALKESGARLQLANFDLENTVVRAPVDGLVGNRHLGLGQYLRPGMQVFTLVPLPNVYVTANFKETQIAHMRVGQSVELTVDSFPGESLTGIIESFAPASGSRFSLLPPENASGNFTKITQRLPVRIRIVTDGTRRAALRPGMSVVASVDTQTGGYLPKSGQGLAEASRPLGATKRLLASDDVAAGE